MSSSPDPDDPIHYPHGSAMTISRAKSHDILRSGHSPCPASSASSRPVQMFKTHSQHSDSTGSFDDDVDSPCPVPRFSVSSSCSNQTAITTPRTSVASSIVFSKRRQDSLRIGQRVTVESMSLSGTLRFLGTTEFKAGIWAGIELDTVGAGKNDGSVNGVRYFTCPPNTGIFVMSSKITIETGQKQQQQRSPRIAAVSRTDAASTSPLSNLQQQHRKNVQPSASKSHTISKRPSLSSLSEVASTRQQDRQRQACKPANTTPRPSVSVSSVFQPQTGIPSPEMTPTNSDVQHDKIKHNFEDADQQILPSFQNDGTDHIKFQYKCIKKYGATSKLEKEHAGKSSDLGDSTVGQSLNAFDAPTCHPLETAYECSRCIEANCDLDKLREEHQSTLDKLAQMDETLANQSQLIATYRKEITSLEQTIDELKRAGMETIELYETSLHRHDTDMKRYTAKLAGAHAKIQSLEAERQKLVEAREASEALVDRHKHEKMEIQDAFERQRREMEQIISELQEKLKQQNQVEEFEKMKTAWQSNLITIEEQLEASKRALTEERNCHQKTRDERDTLASQLQVIQKNIQEKEKLHQQRIRELEQSLADASEKQQSMAEQLTRLREQQAAMEHHLLTAQENLSKAQTTIAELQDQLGKSQFTQSQWASRLRELESENSQLRSERQMIQEAHQNLESECARLQGQLKELPPHPPDANNFTDQQLVRQLQAQLGEAHREIELLRREKAAEAERYAAREQSHRREVNTLYRDISQLESLIEAKTFKEVDLLETLEHERRTLKSLLENRHSRNSICECGKLGIPSERRKTALSISSVPIITTSPALEEDDDDNDDDTPYCEICQVAGHDLMGCTALLEQISPNVPIRSQCFPETRKSSCSSSNENQVF